MKLSEAINIINNEDFEQKMLKVRVPTTHKTRNVKVDKELAQALLKLIDLAKAVLEEVA